MGAFFIAALLHRLYIYPVNTLISLPFLFSLFLLLTTRCPETPPVDPDLLGRMYAKHPEIRYPGLDERRFAYADIIKAIEALKNVPGFEVGLAGKSVQGRDIHAVRWGKGPVKILLWSQMHGDEPTATMALLDLWKTLKDNSSLPEAKNWSEKVSLYFLPLLNPDGAVAYQRRNALGIDLNRDALRLTSPESRILNHWRDSLDADWGFNLHDQHRYYSAGYTNLTAAVAFLAPPPDLNRSNPPHRQDAMKLIGLLGTKLEKIIPGQISRYSDAFENRAFGDNFTARGTRTVLIEAGWLTGDNEKQTLRRLYFATLVASIEAISTSTYQKIPLADYNQLPFNQNRLFELLIREATLEDRGNTYVMDIAFKAGEYGSGKNWYTKSTIADLGDLNPHSAHHVIDGKGLKVIPAKSYSHVLTDMDALRETPVVQLIQQGYAVFRMSNTPVRMKYLPIPIAIRHPDDDASEPILPDANPIFYLADIHGVQKYLVVNGIAWDLNASEWQKSLQAFLTEGLD